MTPRAGGRGEGDDLDAPPRSTARHDAHGAPPGRPDTPERAGPEEPPPFLGSWGRLYAIVLLNLIVLIALFYFFTKAFE